MGRVRVSLTRLASKWFCIKPFPLYQMFRQPFKVLLTLQGNRQARSLCSCCGNLHPVLSHRDTSTRVAPAAMIHCSVTLELMSK